MNSKSTPNCFKPIAIIGMSCRLPGAVDTDAYWDLLMRGGDASAELSDELLNDELYFNPTKSVRGKSYSKVAALEPRLPPNLAKCRLTEAEAKKFDRCHLTLCENATDALRDAGFEPEGNHPRKTGIYYGHTGGSEVAGDLAYSFYVEKAVSYLSSLPSLAGNSPQAIDQIAQEVIAEVRTKYGHLCDLKGADLSASMGTRLIARAYGFEGPCAVIDAACASSMQALAMACRALQQGALEMAVIGGASCYKSDSLVLFSQAQSVSSTKSRPFDAEADGLITAEGHVAFVLKTLESAVADGDQVKAVIRGVGVASDGKGKSLWAPLKTGQSLAVERAYRGNVSPAHVQYIEAHATSTQIGDATELSALSDVFKNHPPVCGKIAIGSVKGNVGHTLESAGVAGIAKVVLAIHNRIIPPQANLITLNPSIDWDQIPFHVPTSPQSWNLPAGHSTRLAAVNSFGIGGLNVHVLLEEFIAELPLSHYGLPDDGASVVQGLHGDAATATATARQEEKATLEPIAIIGRGAILPSALDWQSVEDLLRSDRSVLQPVPPERWDSSLFVTQGQHQRFRTRSGTGGFIVGYQYDWRKHRVPPKQVANANPLQFMLLDAAEQSLTQAGLDLSSVSRDRIGVVVGTIFGGDFSNELQLGLRIPEFQKTLAGRLRASSMTSAKVQGICDEIENKILAEMPALLDETGSFTSSTLASRLTKTFDLHGGAMSIDAGSGSGAAALSACIDTLRSGDCDLMICSAGQRTIDMTAFEALDREGMLSIEGEEASGSCSPGEGAAVLLLKRLSDAQKNGDQVLAVIHDTTFTSVRDSDVSMEDHSKKNERISGRLNGSLSESRTDYPTIDCTLSTTTKKNGGTPTNDRSLIKKIGFTGATHPLVGIIQGSLQPTNDQPTIVRAGDDKDGYFDILISKTGRLPAKENQARVAAHAVPVSESALRLVRFGGTTIAELKTALESGGHGIKRFERQHSSRIAFLTDDSTKLESQKRRAIVALSGGTMPARDVRLDLRREGVFLGTLNASGVAFLFPGQGAQYSGMLNELIRECRLARQAVDSANLTLSSLGHTSYAQLVETSTASAGRDILATQASLLVAQFAIVQSLRGHGVHPSVVAGHSFGEYAALLTAGAWGLADALLCSRKRAEVMQKVNAEGSLAAISANEQTVQELIDSSSHQIFIANLNATNQTVVGGKNDQIDGFLLEAAAAHVPALKLRVGMPFHTPLMKAARIEMTRFATDTPLVESHLPVVLTSSAISTQKTDDFRHSLAEQLDSPIDFLSIGERISETQPGLIVDVGPSQTLSKLLVRSNRHSKELIVSADDSQKRGLESILQVVALSEIMCCEESHQGRPTRRGLSIEVLEFDATATRRQRMAAKSKASRSKAPSQTFAPTAMPATAIPAAPLHSSQPDSTYPTNDNWSPNSGSNGNSSIEPSPANSSSRDNYSRPSNTLKIETHESNGAAKQPTSEPGGIPQIEQMLIDFVVEQTGYPEDIVELDADLEADLGIDSIKKAQLFGELGEELGIAPQADLSLDDFPTLAHVRDFLTEATGATPLDVASSPAANGYQAVVDPQVATVVTMTPEPAAFQARSTIEQMLIDFVVEQTGYPEDIVELDADLEADLGIDSIKKAQLFGELGEELGIAPQADLSLDDFPTLAHVRDFLTEATGGVKTIVLPKEDVEQEGSIQSPVPPPTGSGFHVPCIDMNGFDRRMGLAYAQEFESQLRKRLELALLMQDLNVPNWLHEFTQGIAEGLQVAPALTAKLFSVPVLIPRELFGGGPVPISLANQEVIAHRVFAADEMREVLSLGYAGSPLGLCGANAYGLAIEWRKELPEATIASPNLPLDLLSQCKTLDELQHKLAMHSRELDGWVVLATQIAPNNTAEVRQMFGNTTHVDLSTGFLPQLAATGRIELTDPVSGEVCQIRWTPKSTLHQTVSGPSIVVPSANAAVMRRHTLRTLVAVSSQALPMGKRGQAAVLIGDADVAKGVQEGLETCGIHCSHLPLDEHLPNRIALLMASSTGVQGIVYVAPSPEAGNDLLDASRSLFSLCQTWTKGLSAVSGGWLTAITRTGSLGFGELLGTPFSGAVTGLFKAIRREIPELRVKVIDVPSTNTASEAARFFLDEFSQGDEQLEVAFHNGQRHVVAAQDEPANITQQHLAAIGPWIVTGGARGVTAEVALRLGQVSGGRMHLIGTTPAPADDAPWRGLDALGLKQLKRDTAIAARQRGDSPSDHWRQIEKEIELDKNLQRYKDAGVEATYHLCDVSDSVQVENLLESVRLAEGPIVGVMHGAGVEAACRFDAKKTDSVLATIASKCLGADHLIRATQQDDLRYFVSFGSTSGRFGGLGQTDYSMASDLLAKMMGRLRASRPNCRAVCFHWPAWADVGMAARPESRMALQASGLTFMSPDEGADHLLRELLSDSDAHEVLILDGPGMLDTDKTMSRSSTSDSTAIVTQVSGSTRLLGSPEQIEPGVWRFPVRFRPATDRFLTEHLYLGRPILPGVVAMDLFCRAASRVVPDEMILGLKDVLLERAIQFEEGQQEEALATLTIRQKNQRVFAELRPSLSRDEKTGSPYLSAEIILGEKIEEPIPVLLGEPVYGWTPFVYPEPQLTPIWHGESLRTFTDLDFQHDGGRAIISGASHAALYEPADIGHSMLPAAALDGILVACGVYSYAMVDRHVGLPHACERVILCRMPREGEICGLRFFYRGADEKGDRFDATLMGDDGTVILQLEGYQTKLLSN